MFGRRTTASPAEPAAAGPAKSPGAGNGHANAGHDLPEAEPLYAPAKAAARKSVEALLLERGQTTEAHLVQARQVSAQTPGKSLAQILLSMSAASEGQILPALAETLSLPFETPEKSTVDARAFEM